MNKTCKKFYKDVKSLFPIHKTKEKDYLKKIKSQIEECESNSYEELEQIFGTPIDIVKAYYDIIDSEYLLSRMNTKRTVTMICLTILIIVTCYFGYRTYSLNEAINDFKTNIPVEIEETIEVVE